MANLIEMKDAATVTRAAERKLFNIRLARWAGKWQVQMRFWRARIEYGRRPGEFVSRKAPLMHSLLYRDRHRCRARHSTVGCDQGHRISARRG